MTGTKDGRKRWRSFRGYPAVSRRAVLAGGFSFFTALLCGAGVRAAAPAAVALTPQDNADLQRIAAYLTSIRTMYAKFQQVSTAGGASVTGQLWMARPGRMRFEYNPPSQILLLADMFYVYYIDKELVQMSKVGLKSTPAWLLLRDPITFNDLIVTRFERGANTIRVTVLEKAEPDSGSLTMVFSDNPLTLRQWSIVDQQRKTITVSLYDERFGMALDPKLFVYQDPYAASRRQYEP
jgi:outer membrane lipoprotein-sorting protein